jgi:hypothetical protein
VAAADDGVRVGAIGCSDFWPTSCREVGWLIVSALVHGQRASVLAEASVGDTDTVKDGAHKAVS